ncbi:MAG: hypothetical protein AB1545_13320 [Thermodesulfobacteriota bacterium]
MSGFKDYGSKNLLSLADEHISIIKSIVEEAVDKFGFKERPLKNFHTKPGYIKLEAKVKVMNTALAGMLKSQKQN